MIEIRYVRCNWNAAYKGHITVGELYRVIDDPAAETRGLLRIIDDNGAQNLYPLVSFDPITPEQYRAEKIT